MSSLAVRILTMIIVSLAWFTPAAAENKLAFVVGIDSYPNFGLDAQLQRAVADADTVAQALKSIDFKVTSVVKESDTKEDQLLRQFSGFLQDVQPGDTVLFYYSGHGVGLNESNFLLPSDTPDMSSGDEYILRSHAISEGDIVARIKARGARVTILVIDACRSNPFSVEGQKSLNLAKGLQPMDLAEGTMSIYAAGFGQKAFDRLSDISDPSPNSVFTRVFVAELKRPNINLVEFAENIRDRVATLARSANLIQIPAVHNELLGARTIFLAGQGPDIASTAPVQAIPLDMRPPGLLRATNANSKDQIGGALPPHILNPPMPEGAVKASSPPSVLVMPPSKPLNTPSKELNRRSATPLRKEAATGPVGRADEKKTRLPPPDKVSHRAAARPLPLTSAPNRRGLEATKAANVSRSEEGSAEACDWICRSTADHYHWRQRASFYNSRN